MCLAVPMEVVKPGATETTVSLGGVERVVNSTMAPQLKKGDRVLVHAGFIIEKLDPRAAEEMARAWGEYCQALEKNGERGTV